MKRTSFIIERMKHVNDGGFNLLSKLPVPHDIEEAEHISVCAVFWFIIFHVFDLVMLCFILSFLTFLFVIAPIMTLVLSCFGYATFGLEGNPIFDLGIMILALYGIGLVIMFWCFISRHISTSPEKEKLEDTKPSIFGLMYKSWKDKMCYFIKIED